MVCTSLGSLLRPLFYFLCYIHFSLSVQAFQSNGVVKSNFYCNVNKRLSSTRWTSLYSLILAAGNPTVDYLSLDIEGAEIKVTLLSKPPT